MALTPPSERIWWNEPIAKIELTWIAIAFCWGLIMFFMMIYWHGAGEQNLSNEAYRIKPGSIRREGTSHDREYTVREEEGFPVVHPPPGSDVYLIARLWHVVANTGTGKRPELSAAPVVDGLAARLLAATGEHQHPGPPGLRPGHDDQA